jgi:hypothetical protein
MESTIAKTWHISFNQIRQQDLLAAEYLLFMACVNHINIPRSLLPPVVLPTTANQSNRDVKRIRIYHGTPAGFAGARQRYIL